MGVKNKKNHLSQAAKMKNLKPEAEDVMVMVKTVTKTKSVEKEVKVLQKMASVTLTELPKKKKLVKTVMDKILIIKPFCTFLLLLLLVLLCLLTFVFPELLKWFLLVKKYLPNKMSLSKSKSLRGH